MTAWSGLCVWWTDDAADVALRRWFDIPFPPWEEAVEPGAAARMGEEAVRYARWPEYLRLEVRSRLGRSGHGRLWVPRGFGPLPAIQRAPPTNRFPTHWWPREATALTLGEWIEDAAGIVMRRADLPHIQGLPGVVTDERLHELSLASSS